MARRYKMRAKDSVTAAVFVWLLTSLDFSGAGYPGPNTAQNIQCLGYYDDGAGGGSSLTAPVNPTDDAKLTYANAGNLAYAATVKIAGSGAALAFGTAATAGEVRLPTAGSVQALRNDTLANVALIQKTAADLVAVGDSAQAAGVDIRAKPGATISLSISGTPQLSVDSTANTCTVIPPLQVGTSGGAYATVGLIRTGTLSADATLLAVRVAGNDRSILGYVNSGSMVMIGSDSLDTTFRSEARLRLRIGASLDVFDATSNGSVFRIKGATVADASAADAFIQAPGSNSGNASGPVLNIRGGRRAGSGTPGGVALFGNVDDSTFHKGFQVGSSGSAAQIAFFGGTLTTQQADIGALTVSVGTSDGVVADVGGAFNQTTLNNNFRDLADKINAIRAVIRAYTLTP